MMGFYILIPAAAVRAEDAMDLQITVVTAAVAAIVTAAAVVPQEKKRHIVTGVKKSGHPHIPAAAVFSSAVIPMTHLTAVRPAGNVPPIIGIF